MIAIEALDTARINGRDVELIAGESILQAARRTGHDIPTLCEDPRLGSSGACRLCLVKVKGRTAPIAACSQGLQPGMVVITEDDELRDVRRSILKMVLSQDGSGECSACRPGRLCRLHELAQSYGAVSVTGRESPDRGLVTDANPFIVRDYSQCIYCYRCTMVCTELEGAHAITVSGRGGSTGISTAGESGLLTSPCTFCGQCLQVCPTGALTNRKRAPVVQDEAVERVRTICPYCGTGCGIELHVAAGKVVDITPDWSAPANQGSLCVKGQFGLDFIHHPDRLTTPLVRRNGRLAPASWDEAYGLIVERFQEIKRQSGPNAFALWASGRATNEANYLLQKMGRAVVGTNNIDNCART